jgi:Ca2+-binding EF-hand superfamily protein
MPPRNGTTSIALSPEQELEIKEAFELFDVSGSGTMSLSSLAVAMRALGFEPRKEEMKRIFASLSKDLDDQITFEEFRQVRRIF